MRLQLSRWGTLTPLGGTDAGFARLCAGETGLSRDGWPEWLRAAEGAERLGPVGPAPAELPPPRGVELALRVLAGQAPDPDGLAVIVATTAGAMVEGEPVVGEYVRGEPLSAPRAFYWDARLDGVARAVAAALGATGPALAVSTACTSGTVALGVAADLVRAGRARRALVVGADALCRSTLFGFRSLGVYAPGGCRPFSAEREGMNIGEAAAFVLVEPWRDGARVELLGVGVTGDAHHLTAPEPSGAGLDRAIRLALGAEPPEAVDHVNAHGTGTQPNDAAEAAVLPRLLPNAAVSATKGATGHTLGAAGVVEVVLLVQSMLAGVIPPTVALGTALGVDVAPAARARAQRVGVSTNLAFGGHNAAVAVRVDADGARGVAAPVAGGPLAARVVAARSLSALGVDAALEASTRAGEELTFAAAPDPERPARWNPGTWRKASRLARLVAAVAEPLLLADDPRALFVGLDGGEFASSVAFLRSYWLKGAALASPLAFQNSVHNAPAAHLSIELGLRGHSETVLGGSAALWRTLERALAWVTVHGEPALVVVAADLGPELRDGVAVVGARGRWGEGAAALMLEPGAGPGVTLRWHDGAAPAAAWRRRQRLPDEPPGRDDAPGWDDTFGLGVGAEATALAALVHARGGALAGPAAWLEVG